MFLSRLGCGGVRPRPAGCGKCLRRDQRGCKCGQPPWGLIAEKPHPNVTGLVSPPLFPGESLAQILGLLGRSVVCYWLVWSGSPGAVVANVPGDFTTLLWGLRAASPPRGRVQHVFIQPDKHRDPFFKSSVNWNPLFSPEPHLPKGWVGRGHYAASWRD